MHKARHVSTAPTYRHPGIAVRTTDTVTHCLVVAPSHDRRENLGFAAREGGWDVTLCADSEEALAQARQRPSQMAIVDLSGCVAENGEPHDSPALRFLIEQLACTSRMLLLVCGNLDDPSEEVWARHLGVWMYLPGAIDGTELVSLCSAARDTAKRMAVIARPSGGRGGEQKTFRLS